MAFSIVNPKILGEPSSLRRREGMRRSANARRARLCMESLESRLTPTTSTWSGATSALWSVPTNWSTPPAAANDLAFPSLASNTTNTNDLTTPNTFGAFTLSGTGYNIGGNAITLSGLIDSSQATGSNTVALPITRSGSSTVSVDQSAAKLVLGGVVGGTVGLTKTGAGTLALTAANTYTGTTVVSAGSLQVDGTQGGSPVTLGTGTTLLGVGTVGPLTSSAANVKPGDGAPGTLTVNGGVILDTSSTATFLLNGATAGSTYSQIASSGPIALNNANLNLILGFTPTANEHLTIIHNTGSAAVAGTFASLPEGAVTTVAGQSFRISYAGGSGHDVVLTHLLASSIALATSPNAPVAGQPVTLTATVTPTGGTGAPTGTVQFFNGISSIGTAVISGTKATLATSSLPAGSNVVTAKYLGDASFNAITSTVSTVTVSKASSTTTLTAAPNPSAIGQKVTLTAKVAPVSPSTTTPTGTVQFFNGSTSLGTGTLVSGTASVTISNLAQGANSITAVYSGDTNVNASTSTAMTQNVGLGTAGITLSISKTNPVAYEAATLTATVSALVGGRTPGGTVTFFANGREIGTGTISSGTATLTTTALPIGTDVIAASYGGDTAFAGATSNPVTASVGTAQEQLLDQVYLVVLNRDASLAELDSWRTQITLGTPLKTVIREIVNSPEASNNSVIQAYNRFEGVVPTAAQILAGTSKSEAALDATILGSPAFFKKSGSTVNGFLTALYQDVVGTTIPSATEAKLANALKSGASRHSVAHGVVNSKEGRAATINRLFETVLNRTPTTTESNAFAGLLNRGVSLRTLTYHLLTSKEFTAKYSP